MCGGCCNKMLRATICSVNLLVMITGVLITLSGLWLLSTESHSPSILTLSVLATGLVTLTVSFLACCGSLISSSCLLGTFLVLLVSIIIGEAALGVAVYTEVFDPHLFVSDLTQEIVKSKYSSNNTLTVMYWDAIQSELECCGSLGPLDWATSNYNDYSKFTREIGIRADTSSMRFILPNSCCRFEDDPKCKDSILPQFNTVINPDVYYTEGCSSILSSLAEKNKLISFAILAAIVLLEILAVIFSCCLCCRLNKKSTNRV